MNNHKYYFFLITKLSILFFIILPRVSIWNNSIEPSRCNNLILQQAHQAYFSWIEELELPEGLTNNDVSNCNWNSRQNENDEQRIFIWITKPFDNNQAKCLLFFSGEIGEDQKAPVKNVILHPDQDYIEYAASCNYIFANESEQEREKRVNSLLEPRFEIAMQRALPNYSWKQMIFFLVLQLLNVEKVLNAQATELVHNTFCEQFPLACRSMRLPISRFVLRYGHGYSDRLIQLLMSQNFEQAKNKLLQWINSDPKQILEVFEEIMRQMKQLSHYPKNLSMFGPSWFTVLAELHDSSFGLQAPDFEELLRLIRFTIDKSHSEIWNYQPEVPMDGSANYQKLFSLFELIKQYELTFCIRELLELRNEQIPKKKRFMLWIRYMQHSHNCQLTNEVKNNLITLATKSHVLDEAASRQNADNSDLIKHIHCSQTEGNTYISIIVKPLQRERCEILFEKKLYLEKQEALTQSESGLMRVELERGNIQNNIEFLIETDGVGELIKVAEGYQLMPDTHVGYWFGHSCLREVRLNPKYRVLI